MIINKYITLMPVILAGICNMIFTKTHFYKRNKYPMDFGKTLWDGKRILGDHKTFIGFISMVMFGAIMQCLWGSICQMSNLANYNELYRYQENTLSFNLWVGACLGFAYMICELPNSFIKRRIGIQPGRTNRGSIGRVFFVMDQVDSIIGVVLVLSCFTSITLLDFSLYIILGAGTHIVVNSMLYALKIRKYL